MANPLRGEAEFKIGDKTVTLTLHFAAMQAIAKAIGARTMSDLAPAVFVIDNVPLVLKAALAANGVKDVSDADIDAMDWGEYMGPFLDGLLRREPRRDDADPQKSQRKKS